jgi:carbonic anhydrase
MKKRSIVVIILVALSVVCGSVIAGLAQQQRPIVGGYKEIATDAPGVQEAAEFAVGAQGKKENATIKLVSVEHAESQVVAGMNYRLCLKVEVSSEDEDVDVKQQVKVVVFRSLQKQYTLRSWEEEDCSESE